jgi:hypothetical protein
VEEVLLSGLVMTRCLSGAESVTGEKIFKLHNTYYGQNLSTGVICLHQLLIDRDRKSGGGGGG